MSIRQLQGRSTIITAEQLVQARNQAHMTQPELADRIGMSESTIAAWERKGVARGKEGLVRGVLGTYLEDGRQLRIESFSNAELMLELARRLGEGYPRVADPGHTAGPDPSGQGLNEDAPTSGLRYGNTGKPGKRRTHQE